MLLWRKILWLLQRVLWELATDNCLICIKQLYFSLPPAFSAVNDILGKLVELLSAANSTVHRPVLSIFILSTMNDGNVTQDTAFWTPWKKCLSLFPNSFLLSVSKTVYSLHIACTQHWTEGRGYWRIITKCSWNRISGKESPRWISLLI